MYRMDAERLDTLASGEVDYEHLRVRLAANAARPAIININVGTTVKVRRLLILYVMFNLCKIAMVSALPWGLFADATRLPMRWGVGVHAADLEWQCYILGLP